MTRAFTLLATVLLIAVILLVAFAWNDDVWW